MDIRTGLRAFSQTIVEIGRWLWSPLGSAILIALFVVAASVFPIRKVFPELVVLNIDQNFSGVDASLAADKTVHLLLVHGMGIHCIGYSRELVDGVVRNLKHKLRSVTPVNKNIEQFSEANCLKAFEDDSYFVSSDLGDPTKRRPTTEAELCWQLSKHNACELIEISETGVDGQRIM